MSNVPTTKGAIMWARVTSFEGVNVAGLREAHGQRPPDELIPAGLRGILTLVDPDGSRQLFISLFNSREEIEAAEPLFERMGDEFPEELRGRRVSRDYYEVTSGLMALVGDLR
jgi:hypothetical protein